MESFTAVTQPSSFTYEDRKSVFIGEAIPCQTEEEAIAFLEKIRKKYPGAKHYVYAYVLREGHKKRYSDDHEPQGTAGMPVLEVIEKKGCTDTCVVVTRYFGGTLLGTGGLVKAYTAAAAGAVEGALPSVFRSFRDFTVTVGFKEYHKLSSFLSSADVLVLDTAFAEQVTLYLSSPEEKYQAFLDAVQDATGGKYDCKTGEILFRGEKRKEKSNRS